MTETLNNVTQSTIQKCTALSVNIQMKHSPYYEIVSISEKISSQTKMCQVADHNI